jgi:hypothetical protein
VPSNDFKQRACVIGTAPQRPAHRQDISPCRNSLGDCFEANRALARSRTSKDLIAVVMDRSTQTRRKQAGPLRRCVPRRIASLAASQRIYRVLQCLYRYRSFWIARPAPLRLKGRNRYVHPPKTMAGSSKIRASRLEFAEPYRSHRRSRSSVIAWCSTSARDRRSCHGGPSVPASGVRQFEPLSNFTPKAGAPHELN